MPAYTRKATALVRPALLGLAVVATGCTMPTYSKTVITKYDANVNLTGTEEHETIVQRPATSSPFKVRLNQRSKLED